MPAQDLEISVVQAPPKKRKVWPWLAGILAALILVGAGVLIGWSLSDNAVKKPMELPEEFFVKDVSFTYVEGEGLHYQFTPSVAGNGYTYYITFGSDGFDQRGNARYKNGVCSGVVTLEPREKGYAVYFVISNGFEGLRAEGGLRIHHDGSYPD